MKSNFSFINFPNNFPIKISLKKVTNHENDWHTIIKIYYVVEGNAIITINSISYNLKPDDIILINPWTIYDISAEAQIAMLDIEIDLAKFGFTQNEIEDVWFECNQTSDYQKIKYKIIKAAIFALIRVNTQKVNDNVEYLNQSLAYQILFVLMNQFKIKGNERKKISQKYFYILKQALDYIDQNFADNITLNDLASYLGYTPQYFSLFFQKHMKENFQNYYDTYRINKYLSLLQNSDISLEEIAIKSGFGDYRSYIRAFKNIYTLTPSEFRKNKDNQIEKDSLFSNEDIKRYLDIIFKYDIGKIDEPSSTIEQVIELNVDFNKKTDLINKNFMNMLFVGKASDLLRQNVRTMLDQVQKEVGFKLIRFHGLFSDDMHVYRKFVNNDEAYSFVFIDQVFDYIKSLNLKPFIELSYMPRDLALNPNNIIYESKFVVSPPKSLDAWCNLVKTFFYHMIEKYTLDEVLTWPITIWNKPDSTKHAFGFDNNIDFFMFYKKTYETIKEISKKFNVGSPTLIPFASFARDFDKEFLTWTRANNCHPDFLSVAYYSNDYNFFIEGKKKEKLTKNPNGLKDYLNMVKDISFYQGSKVYLTEWNITSSQRNYLNDTIFSSCYFVKNILENMDEALSFTKWGLTDFIDETQLPNQTYHGGLGFFTYNGICKASYQAIKLLSKLSNNKLEQGNGYYITKNSESIQIVLYNYEHYNDLYADGEYFTLQTHSRYEPFQLKQINTYKFTFNNLNFDYAKIKITRITKESGSSYDINEAMTNIEFENIDETMDLKKLSTAKYELFGKSIENNSFDLSISLRSLETKLIEIKLLRNSFKNI